MSVERDRVIEVVLHNMVACVVTQAAWQKVNWMECTDQQEVDMRNIVVKLITEDKIEPFLVGKDILAESNLLELFLTIGLVDLESDESYVDAVAVYINRFEADCVELNQFLMSYLK